MRARGCLTAAVLIAVAVTASATGPPVCETGSSDGAVQAPVFVRNLTGQTSWFASPIIADLDGDGSRELIAAYYDVFVFSSDGTLLDRATDGSGRVYAPHVVADLDRDGTIEVVIGRGHEVIAFEWTGSALQSRRSSSSLPTTAATCTTKSTVQRRLATLHSGVGRRRCTKAESAALVS